MGTVERERGEEVDLRIRARWLLDILAVFGFGNVWLRIGWDLRASERDKSLLHDTYGMNRREVSCGITRASMDCTYVRR